MRNALVDGVPFSVAGERDYATFRFPWRSPGVRCTSPTPTRYTKS
ncbi:hypothetical protein IC007_0544 [Sulfuracidifex tepidarius]|uniref:Uncharacterized protein n=1 Tax=Sulfuracidifex tepidarius TaxID=1294262 RepID=A0A510E0M9_9CREN|nr:hypothetical protein IC007_0544 [Sulfuracidifex tepidarius]